MYEHLKIRKNQRIVAVKTRKFEIDKNRTYANHIDDKPKGLWYGVGTSWLEWCEGAEFCVGGHIFKMSFPKTRMCRIQNIEELIDFIEKYKDTYATISYIELIDWARVVEDFPDGIEIAPYLWEARHKYFWYCGWDCASGCIWNPKIIYSVNYLGEWKKNYGERG